MHCSKKGLGSSRNIYMRGWGGRRRSLTNWPIDARSQKGNKKKKKGVEGGIQIEADRRKAKRINTHLSRCYVNRFVEDQPYRRLPTTGVSRAALVSHVTVRVWKEALQRQVTYGRSIACTERGQSLVTNIHTYIYIYTFFIVRIYRDIVCHVRGME